MPKGVYPRIEGKRKKGYKRPPYSKEWIDNMKGRKTWNKGIKRTDIVGSKNGRWKGGVMTLYNKVRGCFEMRQWRSDIFTRDKFICQKCGDRKGGNLNAHHIKAFAKILEEYNIKTLEEALKCEELWNLNNGITLCDICHKKKHAKITTQNPIINNKRYELLAIK